MSTAQATTQFAKTALTDEERDAYKRRARFQARGEALKEARGEALKEARGEARKADKAEPACRGPHSIRVQ